MCCMKKKKQNHNQEIIFLDTIFKTIKSMFLLERFLNIVLHEGVLNYTVRVGTTQHDQKTKA